ncbi:MAG: DNA recombination protein RmuC [Bacillaceae bacterium]
MEMVSIVMNSVSLFIVCMILIIVMKSKKRDKDTINEVMQRVMQAQGEMEKRMMDEIRFSRQEQTTTLRENREEIGSNMNQLTRINLQHHNEMNRTYKTFEETILIKVEKLMQTMEGKLEKINETLTNHLTNLQESNASKLEEMRKTVDEKLHDTLEKRLGDSFKLVSDRLEQVHQGLGEMKTLANGVGDLKKVLSNVKTRGTWGEIQLGSIMEQLLVPEQYETNVITIPGKSERVEYAIKIPSKNDNKKHILLPIDSKFPIEVYQRLIEAQEEGNVTACQEYLKALENAIKLEAKTIYEKYVSPPYTTDFAIMFLPTEGLYAEVLRKPGLAEYLQREYRIIITGPTTITAIINALQVGFRTLAIEKRSSEVWQTLGIVKTEFGKFGDILDKTHKKLQEATNKIEEASRKTRGIERKLRKVQELPAEEELVLEDFIGTK